MIKIPPDYAYLFHDERNSHSWRSIQTCTHIRSLREYIDDETSRCLVFEWMDRTLWDAKDESIECKLDAFKTVATSCLKGLLAFQKMDRENDYCHAGQFTSPSVYCLNPSNTIAVSNPFRPWNSLWMILSSLRLLLVIFHRCTNSPLQFVRP